MTSIYTLTALQSGNRSSRCWGWYPTLAEAEDAVTRNLGGMDDCLYIWLVIESVQPGIFAVSTVVSWYRWSATKDAWVSAPQPDWAVGTINFGIG